MVAEMENSKSATCSRKALIMVVFPAPLGAEKTKSDVFCLVAIAFVVYLYDATNILLQLVIFGKLIGKNTSLQQLSCEIISITIRSGTFF